MYLFSCTFLENLLSFLNDNVDEEGEIFSNSQNSASGCCLAFAWVFGNLSLALLIKVLLIKKSCIYSRNREMFKMLGNSMKNTCKCFSKCKVLLTRKKCGTTLYSNYRFLLVTCCVWHPHTVPFLRNSLTFFIFLFFN